MCEKVESRREELEVLASSELPGAPVAKALLELADNDDAA